jgi:hypothetical protein
MQIDFVTLWELVETVSLRMEVEEHFLRPSLNPVVPSHSDDALLETYRDSAIIAQRRKELAAALLLQTLGYGPKDLLPEWVERSPAGGFIETANARIEGLDLLGYFVWGARDAREADYRSMFRHPRWGGPPRKSSLPEAHRYRSIGFERGALICFLEERKIRHGLGLFQPLKKSWRNLLVLAPNFKNPLRDELREAWLRAADKNDYRSIFEAFIDLAEERKNDPNQPLRGYLKSQNAVRYRWLNMRTGDEQIKLFTEEQMRGRMRGK